MNPRVSIITPAFRAARFIAQTIESALGQTFEDFEMLVVDDVSPDDTAAIVARYAKQDSRVRLLRHSTNAGPAAARNTALAAARGSHIAFLDADDLWLPPKLERQLAFMEQNRAAMSFTRYSRINEQGVPVSDVIDIPDGLDYHALLKNTAITTSTAVVDRSVTGNFTMRPVFYDDYVCWLELLKRGHFAHGLREHLVQYRVIAKSWSRNKVRSAKEVWKTYRKIEGLGLPYSAFVFAHYAWNAVRKYK